jgi:tetratricopeptide (TPR) repeat protein
MEADWALIRAAFASGQIALAGGDRAVSVGGSAGGTTIVTGDGNFLVQITGATAEAIHAALADVRPQRLFQIKPPPADFTGRTEELNDLLTRLDRGAEIGGLHGLGGIGKTALALKLAQMLAPRYPDAQIYLDLKGTSRQPLSAAQALGHVILSFLPTAKLPGEQGELEGLFHSVLHKKRVMLLMDNAASAEQVRPLMPPEGCALLVTSRRKFMLPGASLQNLGPLKPGPARALLIAIADRIGDHTDEIARLCGYLPLALRLVGQALATRRDLGPAEYARRLADWRGRLQKLDEVETSLELSYELLHREARARWRKLGVFPGRFDSAAAAAVWEEEVEAAQDHVGELFTYSLVEWEEASERYRLHDLVRDFVNARLESNERDSIHVLHADYYRTVASNCDLQYLAGGTGVIHGLALFDRERENIEAGQAWAASRADVDREAAELCLSFPIAGTHVLSLRQHPRGSIHWLEPALSVARRLKDRAGEANTLGNLGSAYVRLGESRSAIDKYEQRLAIAREIGDRRIEGRALGELGHAYANLGETHRAIDHYELHVAIAREIGDRRGEGRTLGNLGNACADLGQTPRAIVYYEQHLAIAREIGDRLGEGAALGNLGNAYADLGEPRRAIEYYEQHLTIAREIGDRRGEGSALGSLGTAYADLGEHRRAIEHYEQDLLIAREIGDRRGEGTALGNLGLAHADLGETRRAIELYEQRLGVAGEVGDRLGEGIVLLNLALARERLGKWSEATADARQAAQIFKEIESPYLERAREVLSRLELQTE